MDGEFSLSFDQENQSFHLEDPATYAVALLAVLRSSAIEEISYSPADTLNSYIITVQDV